MKGVMERCDFRGVEHCDEQRQWSIEMIGAMEPCDENYPGTL